MGIASLDAHRNVLQTGLSAFRTRAEALAGAVDLRITFRDGPQRGAARTLRTGQIVLGASEGADVVLLDAAVADMHVRLRFARSVFGILTEATALAPGVRVAGRMLESGQAVGSLPLPVEIAIGDTVLIIGRDGATAPQAPRRIPRRGRRRGDPVLMVSAGALLLLMLGSAAWTLTQAEPGFTVGRNAPASVVPVRAETSRDWRAEVVAQLDGAGLGDRTHVAALADGLMQVSGALSPEDMVRLREVQVWYDSEVGAPPLIWEVVRLAPLTDLPALGMVRTSAPQAVILVDGSEISLGDTLVDRWRLVGIEPGILWLERDGDRRSVTYGKESS